MHFQWEDSYTTDHSRESCGLIVALNSSKSGRYSRDDHENGIPSGNGNPMGIPWE